MGRSHALTGWCAGLAVAPVLGQDSVSRACLVAVATAGFALLPDLDHHSSTASRLLGPVTRALSAGVRAISRVVYQATKGPRDEDGSTHRTFWHTGVAALLVGALTWFGSALGGAPVVLGILGFAVLLAAAALGDWVVLPVAGVAALVLVDDVPALQLVGDVAGWIGIAAGLGCLVHDLGDGLTKHGVPLLWPIPIRGETFYELRPPRWLRFRSNGIAETVLRWAVFTPLAVFLIPGVWSVARQTFVDLQLPGG